MVKFGYRRQSGSLYESMKTRKYISLVEFQKLLPEYEYYAYDPRCKQVLFILKDMKTKFNCFLTPNYIDYINRSWLFIEVEQE